MTTRSTRKEALQIVQEGHASRARANNFGEREDNSYKQKNRLKWAMTVLERRPCGARRRRDGKPCRSLNVPGRTRCKWHGGLSTGPKTKNGKARSLANLRQYKQRS